MEDNIKLLIEKFEQIKNNGWTISKFKGTGGAGNHFEFLIGKNEDNYSIPDFYGIEIKTKFINSTQPYIGLFTAIPYGEDFFEIQRLNSLYGYPDKKIKILKCLVVMFFVSIK